MLLLTGLIVFLGSHSLTLVGVREGAIARLGGMTAYKIAVGVVSLLGVYLIITGYGSRPYIPVWTPPLFLSHITLLLMLFACLVLPATYIPSHISTWLKHPMLTAVKAWGLGHLLVRGDLFAMLLFGAFLAWAVALRVYLKRKGINGLTSSMKATWSNDIFVLIGGLVLYVGIAFWFHPYVIGVSPFQGMR